MRKIKWNRKKVWNIFSKYIRLKYSDNNGLCKCVTCGKTDDWKNMQAGHYVDGRNNTVLLDERLVHPQCYHCNIGLRGNKIMYTKFMVEKYGFTLNDLYHLDLLKNKTRHLSSIDWKNLGEQYTEKIEKVLTRND